MATPTGCMVDAEGRSFNGDELLYVIVRERLSAGPVAGVVGTLMTNYAFEKQMAALDVGFARAAVGDRYVMELMQERGWLYGGEASGHVICLDRHTTGDGIVAALQVLAAMQRAGKSLSELLEPLRLFPQKLVNVPLADGVDWEAHAGLTAATREAEARVAGRGRVLIRASGTEPKLRLMVEAEDEALVDDCLALLEGSLK